MIRQILLSTLDNYNIAIVTQPSMWSGVVVIPSVKAYEPSRDAANAAAASSSETALEEGAFVADELASSEAPPSAGEYTANETDISQAVQPKMEVN